MIIIIIAVIAITITMRGQGVAAAQEPRVVAHGDDVVHLGPV